MFCPAQHILLVEYLKLHVATPNKWIIFALSSLFPVCNWIKCKYLWSRFHDNHLQVQLFFNRNFLNPCYVCKRRAVSITSTLWMNVQITKPLRSLRFKRIRVMIFFVSPFFLWITLLSFSNYAQKMFSFSVLDRFNFSRFTRLEMHIRLENHQCVTKMQPN